MTGETFEEQLSTLVQDVLVPVGFEVERFTKLPYLSEGDLYHSYYVLYDAVFVLRPVLAKPGISPSLISAVHGTDQAE